MGDVVYRSRATIERVEANQGKLLGKVTGEIELDGKVLVIRRIHVVLELRAKPEHRETAERVHGLFADSCPLYRTLKDAIRITTELAFVGG